MRFELGKNIDMERASSDRCTIPLDIEFVRTFHIRHNTADKNAIDCSRLCGERHRLNAIVRIVEINAWLSFTSVARVQHDLRGRVHAHRLLRQLQVHFAGVDTILNVDTVRRARHVLIGVFYCDVVRTGLHWQILHDTDAVLVLFAEHFRLGWTLDCQAE